MESPADRYPRGRQVPNSSRFPCDNRGLYRTVSLGIAVVALALAAPRFEDPKPPRLAALEKAPPSEPKPHPDVTLRRKPRPLAQKATTEDWPAFLGVRGEPISQETRILKQYGAGGPRLVWELAKGTGYSSPSVAGEYLVYLHRQGGNEIVECLHPETGQSYWRYTYPTNFEDRFGYNNGPRASPVIDGDLVYTYGAQGKLHCLRLRSGQVVWKRDIAAEFGVRQDFFGTATTPLIDGDRLILNVGAPGGPAVVALDKLDGRMLWGVGDQWGPSYATPIAARVHGKRRLFVFAGGESRPPTGGLLMIDPVRGSLDFRFPWRSRSYESVNASCPVVTGNRVLISATYRTGAALLEVEADGGYSKVWENPDFDLHWTTAVHDEGHYYAFSGRNEPDAELTCVRAADGETVWSEELEWKETVRVQGESRTIYGSPYRGNLLQVEGHYLALGEHGHLLWLDLSPAGAKILGRWRLFLARETWSPPVLSRGLLYVSQNSRAFDPPVGPRLLCYDLRAP